MKRNIFAKGTRHKNARRANHWSRLTKLVAACASLHHLFGGGCGLDACVDPAAPCIPQRQRLSRSRPNGSTSRRLNFKTAEVRVAKLHQPPTIARLCTWVSIRKRATSSRRLKRDSHHRRRPETCLLMGWWMKRAVCHLSRRERSDRIIRCDPGEGFRCIDRPYPLTRRCAIANAQHWRSIPRTAAAGRLCSPHGRGEEQPRARNDERRP